MINKPLAAPGDSQIEGVALLNGWDGTLLPAMGLWLGPDCEGDPDVFIGWIFQNGYRVWQVVDLSRITAGGSAVAKYNSWKPITSAELADSYIEYRHATSIQGGGYVILEGEKDKIIRTKWGGEDPAVRFGIGETPTSYVPVHDILNSIGEKSNHEKYRIKDKSMPALRAAGGGYGGRSTSKLIDQITEGMLQNGPVNTEFIKSYEEPLPSEVANDFANSFAESSSRINSARQGARQVPSASETNTNQDTAPQTTKNYLVNQSFWSSLYRSPDKDPYQAMGISPEKLQDDYWNALRNNFASGNPVNVLPPPQLSQLIENRMFGDSRDKPENVRPDEFKNVPPNPFRDKIYPELDRAELEPPKAWESDPTQHPTYRVPVSGETGIETEPEIQVKVEDTETRQGVPAPGQAEPDQPLPVVDDAVSDLSQLEGDFLIPEYRDLAKLKFRRR
ncbi:hypothetical protein TWF730_007834 [Orbilia blumenaviensis]|uniref:Uncharacterized protein n=1 Tax=Orbilia blumenaviensis TaxID=1796055 RepID=A0AAV9VAU0_9PEZI